MAVKKDEARFTIRFNQENPRHKEAIRILNRHGKGMASMIAEALCMYAHYGANFTDDLVKIAKEETNTGRLGEDTTSNLTAVSQNDLKNTFNTALDSFF